MKVEKMSSEEPQKTGLEEKQHSNSILLLKNKDLNRNLSPLHLVAALAGQSSNDIITRLRAHRAEVLAIKEQLEFVRQKFAA